MTELNVKTISVHELKKCCDANPDLCLIDVRENEEWQELHIPGAHLIPQGVLAEKIGLTVPEKNRPIYLHCRGGVRSMHAAEQLLALGYQDVYSIDGGIMEWDKAGYPVETLAL